MRTRSRHGDSFCVALEGATGLEGGGAGGVAEAEDTEVLEAAFEDVDELVVAVGVGGGHKEAGAEDVVVGVGDNAFDGFAVVKEDADPEALHDGCVLMEVEGAMAEISVKGHDEEDGLGVSGSDLLNLSGLGRGESDGVKGVLWVVAQKLIDGADLALRSEAANGVIFEADDDLIRTWRGKDGLLGRAARRGYACP